MTLPSRIRIWGVATVASLLAVVSGRSAPIPTPYLAFGSPHDFISTRKVDPGAGIPTPSLGLSTGGIAFGAVALPTRDDLALLRLDYAPAAPDGERLTATVLEGGVSREVVVPVPDWQLVPTALFAAADQHPVMTLFGTMDEPTDESWLLDNGYDIINFQRAFTDTLLGWRLFHADALILSSAAAELPYGPDGYVLGAGESAPDVAANTLALSALHEQLAPFGDPPFRSYVISDPPEGVTFDVDGNTLILSGSPHWYCWRLGVDEAQASELWLEAQQAAQTTLSMEKEADYASLDRAAFDAKYTARYEDERFWDLTDLHLGPSFIEQLPDVSRVISDELATQGGINPAVYSALRGTMTLSALFRRWQTDDPGAFAEFVTAWISRPSSPVCAPR